MEARPRVWTVFVAYAVAFVATITASSVFVGAAVLAQGGLSGGQAGFTQSALAFSMSLPGIMLGAFASSSSCAGVALSAAKLSREPLAARLRLGRPNVRPLVLVAMVVGGVVLSECLGLLLELTHLGDSSVLPLISRAFASATGLRLFGAVVLVGILPGICEELFFRGYMQTRLRARWGPWPAILVTAAAFGLLHMDLAQSPLTFVIGVYLGWLTERTGSLRPAILTHIVNNVAAVLMAAFQTQS